MNASTMHILVRHLVLRWPFAQHLVASTEPGTKIEAIHSVSVFADVFCTSAAVIFNSAETRNAESGASCKGERKDVIGPELWLYPKCKRA